MRFMKDVMRWVFFFWRLSSTVSVLAGRCQPIPTYFFLSLHAWCVNLVHEHAVLGGRAAERRKFRGSIINPVSYLNLMSWEAKRAFITLTLPY